MCSCSRCAINFVIPATEAEEAATEASSMKHEPERTWSLLTSLRGRSRRTKSIRREENLAAKSGTRPRFKQHNKPKLLASTPVAAAACVSSSNNSNSANADQVNKRLQSNQSNCRVCYNYAQPEEAEEEEENTKTKLWLRSGRQQLSAAMATKQAESSEAEPRRRGGGGGSSSTRRHRRRLGRMTMMTMEKVNDMKQDEDEAENEDESEDGRVNFCKISQAANKFNNTIKTFPHSRRVRVSAASPTLTTICFTFATCLIATILVQPKAATILVAANTAGELAARKTNNCDHPEQYELPPTFSSGQVSNAAAAEPNYLALNANNAPLPAPHVAIKQQSTTTTRRHERDISAQNAEHNRANDDDDDDSTIKAVAWAAKLEQWFTCHQAIEAKKALELRAENLSSRLNESTGAAAINNTTGSCEMHFDGHLCWPESEVNQLVQLPCPQLNLLFPLLMSRSVHGGNEHSSTSSAVNLNSESSEAAEKKQPTQQEAATATTTSVINNNINNNNNTTNQSENSAASAASLEKTNNNNNEIENENGAANKSSAQPQSISNKEEEASLTSAAAAGAKANPRFAYRKCQPAKNNQNNHHHQSLSNGANLVAAANQMSSPPQSVTRGGGGQWQLEADYSECRAASSSTGQRNTEEGGGGGGGTGVNSLIPENSNSKSMETKKATHTTNTNKAAASRAKTSTSLELEEQTKQLGEAGTGGEVSSSSYHYYYFDLNDKWINLESSEHDQRLFSSLTGELERIEDIDIYKNPDLLEQWTLCIRNIMHAQSANSNNNNNNQPSLDTAPAANRKKHHQNKEQELNFSSSSIEHAAGSPSTGWCPIIFDGWRCWPSTKAGEVAYVGCPANQPGFSADRKAHKMCMSDGTWYKHPETSRYWSNYTTCIDYDDLAFRRRILNLNIIGNLISLVALLASLTIFISFKSLNCTRVTIHKNLFLSFITNNLMWIIWYKFIVIDNKLLESNPFICQLWHILLHYFLVSNYFWMFCEGLYLHTLLVVAFVSEDKILKWFYMLGWITPIPITVAYAYNRSYDQDYTKYCWMDESPYNIILTAPIGISLLLNLIFLINIVRVLVTKLRANNSPDTHQTRKAVRATLILIPLLGLHYILTPFRPETKSEWERVYETVAAVCTSFQGLCVAMLFCCCNGEVITVIKKKLKDSFHVKGKRGCSYLNSHNNVRYSNSNNNFDTVTANTRNYNNFDVAATAVVSSSAATNNNLNSQDGPGEANFRVPNTNTLNSLISTKTESTERLSATTTTATSAQQQLLLLQTTSSNLLHQKNSNGANSNNSNSSSMMTTITGSPIQLQQQQQPHDGFSLEPRINGTAPSSGYRKLSSVSQSSNRSQNLNELLMGNSTVPVEEEHLSLLSRPQSSSLVMSSAGKLNGDYLNSDPIINHSTHNHNDHNDDDQEEEKVNLLQARHTPITIQSSPIQTRTTTNTTSFSIA